MSDMQKMPLSLAKLLLKFSLQMSTLSGTASQILLFHKEINRIFHSFMMNLILWVSSTVFSRSHRVGSCLKPVGLICTVQFCENGCSRSWLCWWCCCCWLLMVFRAQASFWALCILSCWSDDIPTGKGCQFSSGIKNNSTKNRWGLGKWRAGRGKEDSSMT